MMLGSNNGDSHNIMSLIKEGSVGAEIGVWKGSSSRQFLQQKPSKLYLVDPWAVRGYDASLAANDFDKEGWVQKYKGNAGGTDEASFTRSYDNIYNRIVEEFGKERNVEICRMTATEWFAQFDEPFLDWIYIDGDHFFTAVYSDFNNALRVVKKGGVIIGDDYKWHLTGNKDKDNVRKGVNQWAKENDIELTQYGRQQVVAHI